MTAPDPRIAEIRRQLVGMYSKVPWPGDRRTDEEMGWRLRSLGVRREDYAGKAVLEVGCGTGDYALWYATHGAGSVTGVDLSDGSLASAAEKKRKNAVGNVTFLKQDALQLELPDQSFDYTYSVGVLHHTGNPLQGFREMVRVTRPGGVIIVSVYNRYSRALLHLRQRICKLLAGDDIDARVRWGARLFPIANRKLNKRYHGLNYQAILYDCYGCPHETLHSAREVLQWFDGAAVRYTGSFAPLRIQDYLGIFALPEYRRFRETFEGFPVIRLLGDLFAAVARRGNVAIGEFRRPSSLNALLCQLSWIPFGLRISCFTIAGRRA